MDTNTVGPSASAKASTVGSTTGRVHTADHAANLDDESGSNPSANSTDPRISSRSGSVTTADVPPSAATPLVLAPDVKTKVLSAAETVDILFGADGSRSGTDGGDKPGEQARRDADDAKAALDNARDDLQRLREDLTGQREQIDRLIARVDAQIAGIDEVLRAGQGQPPDLAFQLMAGQTALADDVEDAEEAAQGAGRSLWGEIKRWLGRAGKKLWAMISRLVKVKEWTLTGKVSTGVLGLAEASISVTFG